MRSMPEIDSPYPLQAVTRLMFLGAILAQTFASVLFMLGWETELMVSGDVWE